MLSTATITYDLADYVGTTFDPRRTKVWASTNIEGDTVVDTDAHKIRLGCGNGTIDDNGVGSITVWIPGPGANPASWQTSIHVDYPDRHGRASRTFGPFTITGSDELDELIVQQEIPPVYLTTVTAQLDTYVSSATAASQSAAASATSAAASAAIADHLVMTDLGTSDGQMAAVVGSPSSQTGQALAGKFERRPEMVLYPEEFGAKGDGVTDDTPAFRAMVAEALARNADTGECYFRFQMRPVTYLLASDPVAPTGPGEAYAQIPLPHRPIALGNVIIFEFKGSGYSKGETPQGITILRSTSTVGYHGTYGAPSVIGGPARGSSTPIVGGQGGLSVLNVVLDGFVIRRVGNPGIAGADLGNMFTAKTRDMTFDVETPDGTWGTSAEPTKPSNIALIMPRVNNNALTACEGHLQIVGAYAGVEFSEHFTCDYVMAFHCITALAPTFHFHGSTITHANIEHCKHLIAGHDLGVGVIDCPDTYLTINLLDIEQAGSGTFQAGVDIVDLANKLRLRGSYLRVLGGTGTMRGPLNIVGGAFVDMADLADMDWHFPGTTDAISFQNGWTNFGSGEDAAAYRKVGRNVELRGIIKSGTVGTPAFILPPGYRPSPVNGSTNGPLFPVVSNAAFGRVGIATDGTVMILPPSSSTYVSLAGISFGI